MAFNMIQGSVLEHSRQLVAKLHAKGDTKARAIGRLRDKKSSETSCPAEFREAIETVATNATIGKGPSAGFVAWVVYPNPNNANQCAAINARFMQTANSRWEAVDPNVRASFGRPADTLEELEGQHYAYSKPESGYVVVKQDFAKLLAEKGEKGSLRLVIVTVKPKTDTTPDDPDSDGK